MLQNFSQKSDHFGNFGGDGNIILKWILRKWDVLVGTGFNYIRVLSRVAGCCE